MPSGRRPDPPTAGQDVFGKDGFRSPRHKDRTSPAEGAAPGEGTVGPLPGPLGAPPEPQEMDATLAKYRSANGPGRVLYLLDRSGSMASAWEGNGGAEARRA
ncbi:hypothetical protein P8605_41230 [Streptomyces sp. T-3]|nr:hypothetical protein [Streptomyces sp. T-3]